MRPFSRTTVFTAASLSPWLRVEATPLRRPHPVHNSETPITTAETRMSPPNAETGEDSSDELVGRWMIEYYRDANSARTNVLGDEPPFIEFGSDGSVTFHTSCNAGSGTSSTDGVYYVPESALDDQPEGRSLRIEDLTIDTATCEGFIGEQNTDLYNDFESASRSVLDEGRLLLLDEFFLVQATPDG
jgi:hypothetical protein